MAALDFPASPTLNQTYTANGRTWTWDGTSWNSTPISNVIVSVVGTANEITATTVSGTTTLSLPSALTFTGKTITGGTFNSGAFNGTVGATTAATGAFTTVTATTPIAGTSGGTGNGFTKFSGPASSEKTFTLPNANATLLYDGGALGTPASGTVTNLTGTASININGTVGATTANTGAFTTGVFNLSSNSDQQETLSIRGNSGVGMLLRPTFAGGTQTNWRIAASIAASNSLEITPSTAAGGTTFSTPVGTFSSTGLAVTGALSATGPSFTLAATGNDSYINFQNSSVTQGQIECYAGDMIYQTQTAGKNHIFRTDSGTVRATLSSTGLAVTGALSSTTGANFATSSGNVGIGVTNPFAKLDVEGRVNIGTGTSQNTFIASSPQLQLFTDGGTANSLGIWQAGIASGEFGVKASDSNLYITNTYSQVLGTASHSITLTNAGNVGIGTSSPVSKLDVVETATIKRVTSGNNMDLNFYNGSGAGTAGNVSRIRSDGDGISNDYGALSFWTGRIATAAITERMRIDSSGNVGIGTTSQGWFGGWKALDISSAAAISGSGNGAILWGNSYLDTSVVYRYKNNGYAVNYVVASDVGKHIWQTAPSGTAGNSFTFTSNMTLDNTGLNFFTNATNPASSGASKNGLNFGYDNGTEVCWIQANRNNISEIRTLQLNPNGGPVTTGAALTVGGALSKASGSFRIEHPLPAKSATHQLVHSFIEGPQADLIYRGKVVLVDGKASVNIDAAATMTDGTFEVLCRDVQCFTTNETGWTAVRGKVVGNILTIEAKDADCTDEISWMVIGERQDPHMMETDWTDDNGKVIVEPLKPSIEPIQNT